MDHRRSITAVVLVAASIAGVAHADLPGARPAPVTSPAATRGGVGGAGGASTSALGAYDSRAKVPSIAQVTGEGPRPTLPGYVQAAGAALIVVPTAPEVPNKARLSLSDVYANGTVWWDTEHGRIVVSLSCGTGCDDPLKLASVDVQFNREPGYGYLAMCHVVNTTGTDQVIMIGDNEQQKYVGTRTVPHGQAMWIWTNYELSQVPAHWAGMRMSSKAVENQINQYYVDRCEVQAYTVRGR